VTSGEQFAWPWPDTTFQLGDINRDPSCLNFGEQPPATYVVGEIRRIKSIEPDQRFAVFSTAWRALAQAKMLAPRRQQCADPAWRPVGWFASAEFGAAVCRENFMRERLLAVNRKAFCPTCSAQSFLKNKTESATTIMVEIFLLRALALSGDHRTIWTGVASIFGVAERTCQRFSLCIIRVWPDGRDVCKWRDVCQYGHARRETKKPGNAVSENRKDMSKQTIARQSTGIGRITIDDLSILLVASMYPLCRYHNLWWVLGHPDSSFWSIKIRNLFVNGFLRGTDHLDLGDRQHEDEALQDFARVSIVETSEAGRRLLSDVLNVARKLATL
jgi:hypothetical protein